MKNVRQYLKQKVRWCFRTKNLFLASGIPFRTDVVHIDRQTSHIIESEFYSIKTKPFSERFQNVKFFFERFIDFSNEGLVLLNSKHY